MTRRPVHLGHNLMVPICFSVPRRISNISVSCLGARVKLRTQVWLGIKNFRSWYSQTSSVFQKCNTRQIMHLSLYQMKTQAIKKTFLFNLALLLLIINSFWPKAYNVIRCTAERYWGCNLASLHIVISPYYFTSKELTCPTGKYRKDGVQ